MRLRTLLLASVGAAVVYSLFISLYFEFASLQISASGTGVYEVGYEVTNLGSVYAWIEAAVLAYAFFGGIGACIWLLLEPKYAHHPSPPRLSPKALGSTPTFVLVASAIGMALAWLFLDGPLVVIFFGLAGGAAAAMITQWLWRATAPRPTTSARSDRVQVLEGQVARIVRLLADERGMRQKLPRAPGHLRVARSGRKPVRELAPRG